MMQTMKKLIPLVATAAAIAVGSGCGKETVSTNATASVATSIVANSGSSGQSGTVGTQLASAISVHVSDQNGNAMKGAVVTWAVVGSGGSVDSTTSHTDANGNATTHWTLGNAVGTALLNASIANGAVVSITANAVAGLGASLTKVSGDNQTVTGVGTVSAPMVVQLKDVLGNPVSGATITWSSASGGALSANSSTTDATGKAQITVTTAATPRTYSVQASASGAGSVTFTMTGN